MKTATFIVLVCLLVVEVKGHSLEVKGRCICADKGVNKVSRKAIEKVEIILPSPSCKRLEIVVTMRGAGQKRLNPGSRFTKKYILTVPNLKKKEKKKRRNEQKIKVCNYVLSV
uniref:Chemokine (C-X-C motif) ligand 11, duplicate 8 n=1 Tax=Sinocyclocheilus anshuiensis TaxID=1608454 RepID=A0A671L440_9TELE